MNHQQLIETLDLSDYEIVDRSEGALKYHKARIAQPELNFDQTIMMGMADMEYKLPKVIYEKMFQLFSSTQSFGYANYTQSLWSAVQKWTNERYCSDLKINKQNTLFWAGTGPVGAAVIESLTSKDDQILTLVPNYPGYIACLKYYKRKIIECPLLQVKGKFYLNYEAIENIMRTHKIKLFLFMNPWNPCGRIWSKNQLNKLKDLIIKYKINVFSDEVFGDAVDVPEKESTSKYFTSMLAFKDLYPYLVHTSSPSKSINFSGMAAAYSIIPNPEIYTKMRTRVQFGFEPPKLSLDLLQVMLTAPEAQTWRKSTIKYLKSNYLLFKELSKEKLPKLDILELDCSFLMVVDFKGYADSINFSRIKDYFTKVNVCPVFMTMWYKNADQGYSSVRLNLSINQSLIYTLVDRLVQMVELPWIE